MCGECVGKLASKFIRNRLHFLFAPYDLWIGGFYDHRRKVWYICVLPTVGVMYERRIDIKGTSEGQFWPPDPSPATQSRPET